MLLSSGFNGAKGNRVVSNCANTKEQIRNPLDHVTDPFLFGVARFLLITKQVVNPYIFDFSSHIAK